MLNGQQWRSLKLFGNNLQEGSMFLILYIALFSVLGTVIFSIARYLKS
jgi:hypothetical protein